MKKQKQQITPLSCAHFSRGSKVQVRNEQGAWFPAQVLEPNWDSSPYSLRNRSSSVLIQYETLVSEEDASKPKTEEIDVSLLRPAPPEDNADEGFEVHDVVDAEKEESRRAVQLTMNKFLELAELNLLVLGQNMK